MPGGCLGYCCAMKDLKHPLTTEEAAEYAECMAVVDDGMAGFVRVGNALLRISDKRLYRGEYSTFEEFCQKKYEMSASRAYQLARGAEVVNALPKESQQIVESQARELAKVPAEKRLKVLKVAEAKGKVTAKTIKEAAVEVLPPAPQTEDAKWRVALGGSVPEVPAAAPYVMEHYDRFKVWLSDVLASGPTDKQLDSLSVALKEGQEDIKKAIRARKILT